MKKSFRRADPHAEREARKYEHPIPSREFILDFLGKSIGPMTHGELCRELDLRDEISMEALRRRLAAMEHDGQLVRNRRNAYGSLDKMNLIKGRVMGHPEGFGFVISGSGEDIFLSSRQMRRVFDGDEVLVRIAGWDRRGRPEGSIVEVVEHRTRQLVGRYFIESGIHFVRPNNPRISQDVIIPARLQSGAKRGQIVVVEITSQPHRQNLPAGKVVEILGEHLDPGMEIDIAVRNFDIPHVWPQEVLDELEKIPGTVQKSDLDFRVDLRKLPFLTIDGEDARDFDDAVCCNPRHGGWTLYVAIADVSHYVAIDSALDREAYHRGNSVYFPETVVPMLPEKLSNNLCSLNPEVDRLCLVCEMNIDQSGSLHQFRFYEGVIHSHARLTYTQVANMLAEKGGIDSGIRKRFHRIAGQIDGLFNLYRALHGARQQRGSIDFDTLESRIIFDRNRKIQQIVPSERTDAHRLIEECMLCANVSAAQLLRKSRLPVLYRVHEKPREEKLNNLREFLSELGLSLPGGDNPTPEDMQSVMEKIRGRADAKMIQAVMLRSMNQAVYQPDNLGHFGLNYEAYTHFTSPIRRYPDLLVHRAIRSLIRSKQRIAHLKRINRAPVMSRELVYPYNNAWILAAGEQCSATERRADEATRNVVNWLKCEYLQDRVGEEFFGIVSAVTGFGLFVELRDLFIEGLIHITGLPKDYYYHEPAHHRLVGEKTRRVFRLGDLLRVKVVRVDLEERKIDFDLIEPAESRSKNKAKISKRAPELPGEYETNRGKKRGKKPSTRSKRTRRKG